MGRDDAKLLLMIGSIFFPLGLVILLITGVAGLGLTIMGLVLMLGGGYYYLRGKK